MNSWTIYDPATGDVVTVQMGGLPPDPAPGQARLDGYWPGDIWVIVDGQPVRKPRP
ncbi:hypothetical protein [Rhodovarius lipocyclicus]|uniref:hypothetical protein n=1 Tax=Rhodovarius lipocyclicus TaxID=268410 RepID=UPI00135C96E6|nr:hypothetical protein [Rhodovarius lipocyclicus]